MKTLEIRQIRGARAVLEMNGQRAELVLYDLFLFSVSENKKKQNIKEADVSHVAARLSETRHASRRWKL